MIRIVFAIFFLLHGLVHMLYFGQSARYFELQSGMVWPDGSWAFSKIFSIPATRNLASVLLVLASAVFVAGGVGIFLKQVWWQPLVVSAAIFSSAIYLLFWDGIMRSLDNKGGVGFLINLAVLVSLLVFHWPDFDF